MNKKSVNLVMVATILVAGFFLTRENNLSILSPNSDSRIEIIENRNPLESFNREFGKKILLARESDLDNSGIKENVIMYEEKNKVWFVIGYQNGEEIGFTDPLPAPLEGQELSFNDFDGDDNIEIILSGYKNDKIGYGVYKFKNKKIIDVFSEGMNECC